MVYGEFILDPSIKLVKLISKLLPKNLNSTYLTNSGTEAIEGAVKLARRYTGKKEIIASTNAYHGSTMGALTFMGIKDRRDPFGPLIPKVKFIKYNKEEDLNKISSKTAAVMLETIQGGAGFITPKNNYLQKVKRRCNEVGALLILDEIQSGMDSLHKNPIMGHITTFGGNPVISACAYATLKKISSSKIMENCIKKEKLLRSLLVHPLIKEIRGKGLMLCLIMENSIIASNLILRAKDNGLLLFWLLINKNAVRITPPLTISNKEIQKGCKIIIDILNKLI